MARSINEIQQEIINAKAQANELTALDILTRPEQADVPNTGSKVSEWRMWVWVVARAVWALEKMFDLFRDEVEERIAATRVHTRGWYKEKALAFQYGDSLGEDDTYPVIDESKRIVKYAAVRKIIRSGRGALLMKLAKDNGGELAPLTQTELDAFNSYINLVADAGTLVIPESKPADSLRIQADIYYDPQVLGPDGSDLNDGSKPVEDTLKAYLKSIDFDGMLIITKLTDALQGAKGVKIPVIKKVEAKTATGQWQTIYDPANGQLEEFYNPDAGWMVDDGSAYNYIAYNE